MVHASPATPSARKTLLDVCSLESVFRNKWWALLAVGAVLAATFLFLSVRERTYRSYATIFVRLGRESVTVDPTAAATGQVLTLSDSQQRAIQSTLDIFGSEWLLEYIVDQMGVDQVLNYQDPDDAAEPAESQVGGWAEKAGEMKAKFREALVPLKLADPPHPRSKAIETLGKSIAVGAEDESNVVSLEVRASSPRQAQKIAELLLDGFQDRHLMAHRSPGSFEFFAEQTVQTKRELDEAMQKLQASKSEAGVASIDAQKQVLSDRMREIQLEMLRASAQQEATIAMSENMTRALQEMPEYLTQSEVTGVTNTSRDTMRAPLFEAELQKAELRSVFKDEHPLVKKADEQVRQAKSVYQDEEVNPQITRALNDARQTLVMELVREQAALASTRARLEELASQQDELRTEITQLNLSEATIVDLQRQVDVLDAKYRRYVDSLEQTRIDQALEQERFSNVNVIQPPSISDDPVDFSNSLIALGGLFAAVLAGLSAAFGMELLRNDLSTPFDVHRELGLPVLATIPASREQRVVRL
jgi:uncharacterized protein involved in exopolysaccharide biosynthesis